jgi:branched-chain amino acid transport system ATP-binding protein
MLRINAIDIFYGKLQAVKKASFCVGTNQIVSLVGSNGAGKTTIMMTISGFNKVSSGTITFDGKSIERLGQHEIVEQGLVLVPEGRMIFPEMSVLENLQMGAYSLRAREKMTESMEDVMKLFPILKDRINQMAGQLSGGQQQMLAIGRGLMARPKLLMLDEPYLGLSPIMGEQIFETIEAIRARGIPILLVEQNAVRALSCSDNAYIIENGEIIMEGKGKELVKDERVKKAYLGL